MPRKMKAPPDGISLWKTTRGSWIAVEEIWSAEGLLVELRPMRNREDNSVIEMGERRDALAAVNEVLLRRELEEARRQLSRYSSAPSRASTSSTSSDAVARVS